MHRFIDRSLDVGSLHDTATELRSNVEFRWLHSIYRPIVHNLAITLSRAAAASAGSAASR